jgi:hypothetical protein
MTPSDDEILDGIIQLTDWNSDRAQEALRRARDEFFSLAFSSETEREVWLAVVAIAAELEWCVARVLWTDDGKPGDFDDYELPNLGKGLGQLEKRGILTPDTRETLKRIKDLRNAVAHRTLTGFGVRASDWKRVGYEVGGDKLNIFVFPVAFGRLLEDAIQARATMLTWLRDHDM